jgi:hypothetical protein
VDPRKIERAGSGSSSLASRGDTNRLGRNQIADSLAF